MNKLVLSLAFFLMLEQVAVGQLFGNAQCRFFEAETANAAADCANENPADEDIVNSSFRQGFVDFLADKADGDAVSVCEECTFTRFGIERTITKLIQGTVDNINVLEQGSVTVDKTVTVNNGN